MELYRNSDTRDVSINVPAGIVNSIIASSLHVIARYGAGYASEFDFPSAVYSSNSYSVTVPYFLMTSDSRIYIAITFDYTEGGVTYTHNDRVYVDIVTPLLEPSIIATISNLTTADAILLERKIRLIVQNLTGQSFGNSTETITVLGRGDDKLTLPKRLDSLTSITCPTYQIDPTVLVIAGNGWFLGYPQGNILTIKEASQQITNGIQPINGVIYAPKSSVPFRTDVAFSITGIWGYSSVPNEIKEAVRILADDYSCMDSAYRDKYLVNVTAAGSVLEFGTASHSMTGNVKADQLISPYVLNRMVVI